MALAYQADNNRPMGRPDPSAPLDLPGRQDLLPTQQASTDHGEASIISSSDRSDGFTQALQKLQACLYILLYARNCQHIIDDEVQ